MSDHISFKLDHVGYEATWSLPADFPRQARRVFDQILEKILFQELREKRQLVYSIRTNYQDFQDVYEYTVNGQIDPKAASYIGELVNGCISVAASRLDMFQRVLTSCRQKCLMSDLSGRDLVAEIADDLACGQQIITLQEVLEGLNRVKFEQMAEMACFLCPERQYTFMVCP